MKTKPIPVDGANPVSAYIELWMSRGGTIEQLATLTGYPASTLYQYRWRAKRRPKTYLPAAEFAAQLARAVDAEPHALRPDLWEAGWKFPPADKL